MFDLGKPQVFWWNWSRIHDQRAKLGVVVYFWFWAVVGRRWPEKTVVAIVGHRYRFSPVMGMFVSDERDIGSWNDSGTWGSPLSDSRVCYLVGRQMAPSSALVLSMWFIINHWSSGLPPCWLDLMYLSHASIMHQCILHLLIFYHSDPRHVDWVNKCWLFCPWLTFDFHRWAFILGLFVAHTPVIYSFVVFLFFILFFLFFCVKL